MLGGMIGRILAAVLLAVAAFAATPAHAQTAGERAEVVVELYTSQGGCTQCPRANRLLGWYGREPRVLALTFPVNIWDYLGWRDTFAQPEFSERQRAYSRALRVRGRFTPQLVMNGARQISAADWDAARATLDQARSHRLDAPRLTITRLRSGRVRVTVGPGARDANADVWLMAYDPGPVSVSVTSGVNRSIVIPHYNLVTRVERVDTWSGETMWFERSLCMPRCAVIVQAPNGGPILAAAYTLN